MGFPFNVSKTSWAVSWFLKSMNPYPATMPLCLSRMSLTSSSCPGNGTDTRVGLGTCDAGERAERSQGEQIQRKKGPAHWLQMKEAGGPKPANKSACARYRNAHTAPPQTCTCRRPPAGHWLTDRSEEALHILLSPIGLISKKIQAAAAVEGGVGGRTICQ